MFGGGSMGRLFKRSPQSDPNLCGEQGGASLPVDRTTGVRGTAERYCKPISEAVEHLHCASSGSMSDFSGRSHLTPGKGGGSETRGGGEDGEAAERRPSGSVDGQP